MIIYGLAIIKERWMKRLRQKAKGRGGGQGKVSLAFNESMVEVDEPCFPD